MPSSPQGPFGKSEAKQKLQPSAGGVVPPPTRALKVALKLLTGEPASRSSMTQLPCWPLMLLTSFRAPPVKPSVVSTMVLAYVVEPFGGRPSSKLAVSDPACRPWDMARADHAAAARRPCRRGSDFMGIGIGAKWRRRLAIADRWRAKRSDCLAAKATDPVPGFPQGIP